MTKTVKSNVISDLKNEEMRSLSLQLEVNEVKWRVWTALKKKQQQQKVRTK